jgi:hypothetical protein
MKIPTDTLGRGHAVRLVMGNWEHEGEDNADRPETNDQAKDSLHNSARVN